MYSSRKRLMIWNEGGVGPVCVDSADAASASEWCPTRPGWY